MIGFLFLYYWGLILGKEILYLNIVEFLVGIIMLCKCVISLIGDFESKVNDNYI